MGSNTALEVVENVKSQVASLKKQWCQYLAKALSCSKQCLVVTSASKVIPIYRIITSKALFHEFIALVAIAAEATRYIYLAGNHNFPCHIHPHKHNTVHYCLSRGFMIHTSHLLLSFALISIIRTASPEKQTIAKITLTVQNQFKCCKGNQTT